MSANSETSVLRAHTERLFSYGTLQLESVQLSTFGRLLSGSQDALPQYELGALKIEDPAVAQALGKTHYGIARFTGRAGDAIAGMVFELTASELADADRYEIEEYKRVEVTLASGRSAWVYVDATDAPIVRNRSTSERPLRIHLLGASGSGTSTLGRALAVRLGCPFYDTDAFYWLPSDPPFRDKRPVDERKALLRSALGQHESWVLSGSLSSWGNEFMPLFDWVVFLEIAPALRLERLRAREVERYGAARLADGGDMHAAHCAFMEWAAAYDSAGPELRSRVAHDAWLATLPLGTRIIRLDSNAGVDELVSAVMQQLPA